MTCKYRPTRGTCKFGEFHGGVIDGFQSPCNCLEEKLALLREGLEEGTPISPSKFAEIARHGGEKRTAKGIVRGMKFSRKTGTCIVAMTDYGTDYLRIHSVIQPMYSSEIERRVGYEIPLGGFVRLSLFIGPLIPKTYHVNLFSSQTREIGWAFRNTSDITSDIMERDFALTTPSYVSIPIYSESTVGDLFDSKIIGIDQIGKCLIRRKSYISTDGSPHLEYTQVTFNVWTNWLVFLFEEIRNRIARESISRGSIVSAVSQIATDKWW